MAKVLPSILCLALGGAAGTLARAGLVVGVDYWVERFHGPVWPWGTVVVNALGCFAFGLIFGTLSRQQMIGSLATLTLLGGFCGAFTTFSTYAFDTARLATTSGLVQAAANVLLHNVIGITLMFAGLMLSHRLVPAAA